MSNLRQFGRFMKHHGKSTFAQCKEPSFTALSVILTKNVGYYFKYQLILRVQHPCLHLYCNVFLQLKCAEIYINVFPRLQKFFFLNSTI